MGEGGWVGVMEVGEDGNGGLPGGGGGHVGGWCMLVRAFWA